VKLEDLKLVKVETGITFGQECYLDSSRAQEFLDKVNEISPNFFTRSDFQQLPTGFALGNANGTKLCIVQPNRFNYFVHRSVKPNIFLSEVETVLGCFRNVFAVDDVRRIGKIYDFQSPVSLTKDSLNGILRIEEPVQINNVQLLFREKRKNINIHFIPVEKGFIEIAGRKIDLEVVVRCDINNIDMSSPLNISETLTEIFEFTDQYVQTGLVNFLNKYFGETS
jgi:hypothetical protein